MKKAISYIMIFIMIISITGCGRFEKRDESKIYIVTTLFPQYDFARHIAGDRAQVKLLLTPGMEAHSFDPTPTDIAEINECDLFLYTGDEMEVWVSEITDSLERNVNIVDVTKGIETITEEEVNGINLSEKNENEHEDEENDEHGHGHEHLYDPHVWTSPVNAMKMVENILEEIVKIDPENEEEYRGNARKYLNELSGIDKEIREIVASSENKTIYFADRFALNYFVKEYGLDFIAIYDSCSAETEPGAKLVAEMIDQVKEKNAKYVFYAEMSNHRGADTVCNETGAKELMLHSCHNVSKNEFEAGETYISLMKKNIVNLRKGLNVCDE